MEPHAALLLLAQLFLDSFLEIGSPPMARALDTSGEKAEDFIDGSISDEAETVEPASKDFSAFVFKLQVDLQLTLCSYLNSACSPTQPCLTNPTPLHPALPYPSKVYPVPPHPTPHRRTLTRSTVTALRTFASVPAGTAECCISLPCT